MWLCYSCRHEAPSAYVGRSIWMRHIWASGIQDWISVIEFQINDWSFSNGLKRLVPEVVMVAVVGSVRASVWEKWGNMWRAAIWRRLLRSATGWRSILYEDRPCTKLTTCVSALLTLLHKTRK